MRLLSWNIQMGLRLPRVVEAITAQPELDFVALQEASVHDGVDDAERIARALGPTYRWWQVTAQELRGEPQANAAIWDTRSIAVDGRSVLELPEPTGRVLGVLPPSRRTALRLDGTHAGRRVAIHVVHLDVWGVTHKVAQFRAVLDDAAQPPRPDLGVIAGDLNTYGPPRIRSWSQIHRHAGDQGYRDVSSPIEWTHAAGRMRQKLDWIFVGPRQVPARAEVVHVGGSDHRPLLLELRA